MSFRNLNTYESMVKAGEESSFHTRYDRAVERFVQSLEVGSTYESLIDGKPVPTGKYFTDTSPIDTELVLGEFSLGGEKEASLALSAARRAFQTWSVMDLDKRLVIFRKAAEIMRRELFEIAAAITIDNGKNRYEAVGEVDEAVDFISFYADRMEARHGFREDTEPAYADEKPISVMRPYGVWAIVCPFNFPIAISAGMLTAAIITGNTAVLKPSTPAPLAVHMLYDVYERAGVPNGVINLLSGSGSVAGEALVSSDKIDGIAFTGSKEVGYRLLSSPRRYPIPVITELGGKNPAIVTEKADLAKAIAGVAISAFGYSGQKCSACSRVYVHELVYDEFMIYLMKHLARSRVGDPRERATFTGPVIHQKALDDYLGYSHQARIDGVLHVGGEAMKGKLSKGFYATPTLVTGLPEDHFLVRNELFLPILCVQRFTDLKDAVRRANDVDYGLTSGIYSDDEDEVNYFFENIEAGVSYANRARGATTGAMVGAQPFGGWKGSGSTGLGSGTDMYLAQYMRQQSRTVSR
ncbi:MAG TPA: aldehyde dehydrogenase family protein [Methanomassiliicoccales archaeon]|nr:aldehyde dehydrogenase family protein [Methanomassiliicoccales archaeon]HPR98103.1 aldehyde dehydrogenase family protein [Methanomassiliicoccales archaeon]